MKRIRLTLALAVTSLLTVVPVVSPVWASPKPVTPAVHTQVLRGVDQKAWESAPAAFDPQQVKASDAKVGPVVAATRRATKSVRPTVLSPTMTTGRFTAAGLSWSAVNAPKDVIVQVRILERGAWGDWQPLGVTDGGPDANTAEAKSAAGRISTEPISTPDGEAVQVRVDSLNGAVPADLKLLTVDPGTSAADANLSGTPGATAQGATDKPAVITRAQWGADESLLNVHGPCPGYVPTIKVAFVHHTVSTNSYTPAESAGLVRGIYAYHVNGNGWCDLGYNFLVDRYGQIFEGRHGGMDRAVLGAHTLAFNYNSFGVSAIGTFSSEATPPAMTNSIAQVIGWKLGLHGRDPAGSATLTSAGGSGARWPQGTQITFNAVSGHRDAWSTECPGNVLYAQLPSIRQMAHNYAAWRTTRDENLYGVWGTTTWSPSGRVELHGNSQSSWYASRMVDAATTWAAGTAGDWRFMMGSSQGDTRPDLIGVHTQGTASGKVEVIVASWASNYTETVVSTTTPMWMFPADGTVQVAVGGPSGGDLYFVLLNTSSRKVEVHSLTAASGYTAWNTHASTPVGTGYTSAQVRFLVANGSGDLAFVIHGGYTGSGRSEFHSLSASSGYRSYITHAALPIDKSDDASAQWILNRAPRPDLMFVKLVGTGSGSVELHGLSAASAYRSFSVHAPTNLPLLRWPLWQFSMG